MLKEYLNDLTFPDTLLGLSVLLLEARDRVGGRTYTVEEDGKQLW